MTRAQSLAVAGIGAAVVVGLVLASGAAQAREARRAAAVEAYRAARAAERASAPRFRHQTGFTVAAAAVGGLSAATACLAGGPLLAVGCGLVGAAGGGLSTYYKQRAEYTRATGQA
jgi:fatty acid desaturase